MNNTDVKNFLGPFYFLSNFYPVVVVLDDIEYPTVEHAYIAAQNDSMYFKYLIKEAPSVQVAREIGRFTKIRSNWSEISHNVMYNLLVQKFNQPDFQQELCKTGTRKLVGTNSWDKTYWNVTPSDEPSRLAVLLMEIRLEMLL